MVFIHKNKATISVIAAPCLSLSYSNFTNSFILLAFFLFSLKAFFFISIFFYDHKQNKKREKDHLHEFLRYNSVEKGTRNSAKLDIYFFFQIFMCLRGKKRGKKQKLRKKQTWKQNQMNSFFYWLTKFVFAYTILFLSFSLSLSLHLHPIQWRKRGRKSVRDESKRHDMGCFGIIT